MAKSGGTHPPAGTTETQKSARALIEGTLATYGLGSLADTVWKWYLSGRSVEQIFLDIRGTPEYKHRFPAMDALAKSGHAISESEYINYEQGASELMHRFGVPKSMYDQPQDFTKFLTGRVALTELQSRLELRQVATTQAPPQVRAELVRLYGAQFAQQALMATFVNPGKALDVLQRQVAAAEVAGQADITGYGHLSRAQADMLAGEGVTADRAAQGFGRLGSMQEIFNTLPGEQGGGIGRGTQLAAEFGGDAKAQQTIAAKQERRKAAFGGGGGLAEGQTGVSGLGSTTT